VTIPPPPGPGPRTAADRVRGAVARRGATDYVFTNAAWNVVLILLTCGVWLFILFFHLMQRDRDHNIRRLELLEGANALAWEQANAEGLADELRPHFERTADALEEMRRLTREFRDPGLWVVIAIFGRGIAEVVGYVFIDQDLDRHDRAEGAAEAELTAIYARLGQTLPTPDPGRVKGRQSYAGRIAATILTCGIYSLWWTYDMQVEGNRHVEANWPWEDALLAATGALAGAPGA